MAEPNIYLPYLMRIAKVTDEAPAVKTFRLEFVNPEDADNFDFNTGQFGLYSAFGEGESTFCIASSPTRKGYIECTFRAVGRVTQALADQGGRRYHRFSRPVRKPVSHRPMAWQKPAVHRRRHRPAAAAQRHLELSRSA